MDRRVILIRIISLECNHFYVTVLVSTKFTDFQLIQVNIDHQFSWNVTEF